MTLQNTLPESFDTPMDATYDQIFGSEVDTLFGTPRQGVPTAPVSTPSGMGQRVSLTQSSQPETSFQRLCNPEIAFVVRAHLSGDGEVVVPSYPSRLFMYERHHWRLPADPEGC